MIDKRALDAVHSAAKQHGTPDTVVKEFKQRFYETGVLGDRYAGSKFAEYLFRRHDAPPQKLTYDHAHHIEKDRVQVLLSELCNSIPARPYNA